MSSDFNCAEISGGVCITRYTGSAKNVTVPAEINGKPVIEIGESAFEGCEEIESVIIPDGVTKIAFSAFGGSENYSHELGDLYLDYWCKNLKTVHIPDSVTEIESNAFCFCTALESIRIPVGVKIIYGETFRECRALKSVIIPNTVQIIDEMAFDGCVSLESIYIPDSVRKIYLGAFYNCKALKLVSISKSLTEIEDFNFCCCHPDLEFICRD